MKKYIQPAIKVRQIETEEMMAASGLNDGTPTSGLDNQPGNGGANDGTHNPSKPSIWSSLDE